MTDKVTTVVIAEADNDTLLEMRELYLIQLGWGLSKMGRREIQTKLGAVEITLLERGVEIERTPRR